VKQLSDAICRVQFAYAYDESEINAYDTFSFSSPILRQLERTENGSDRLMRNEEFQKRESRRANADRARATTKFKSERSSSAARWPRRTRVATFDEDSFFILVLFDDDSSSSRDCLANRDIDRIRGRTQPLASLRV